MDSFIANNNLDVIRKRRGNDWLKATFHTIAQTQPSRAVSLLNQENLSFPTLYTLRSLIMEHELEGYLSHRNQFALDFSANNNPSVAVEFEGNYLKWILFTSVHQELATDEFQEVIDKAAIQLLVVLDEKSVLPWIIDLAFSRNRNNAYIHDLCWAIYQSNSVDTMSLVAKYIRSNQKKDRELACKLLNFKSELQPKNPIQQYNNFLKWFNENKEFLYYTNESMQETCQPRFWRVNLPAKYLCKNFPDEDSLTDEEKEHLNCFRNKDRKSQKLLSKYSYQTYQKDKDTWQYWMNAPIDTQLDACKKERGGKL